MSRTPLASALPGLAVFVLAAGLAAPAAASVQVRILSPQPGQPVFGSTEIEAKPAGNEKIARVEFFVNGKAVGSVAAPPFKLVFDVGDANVKRQFRAVVYGASGSSASDAVDTEPIQIDERMDVELQQLYATVIRDRERVLDLDLSDFRVFDNGAEQKLIAFDRGELPLSAVLLIDSSESMRGERIRAALAGAQSFVKGMRPVDQASVLLFSDRLLRVTPFTSDQAELRGALSGVEAAGGSALNDYLYASLKILEAHQGRRVVVLLSDGADVHSVLSMAEVLREARASQALIYWIALDDGTKRKSFTSAWRNWQANDREFDQLEKTVDESGGRILRISKTEDLDRAFAGVLEELREQYALSYYASNNRNDGRWHKVDVRVGRFGVRVRARDGYIDY
ncbi:MAG TPA: VWA domain-containing protein [Thermoanaerobaculia bacterium]|nr:VWA domain-containing protein [Thermoanaerobaculia bacterium]